MGQPAQSTHEAAHKNINLAKAAKEEARPSRERLRRIMRGNSETASSSASSSKQETSWIYRTKRANKRSNCRPQGCMESQEYPSRMTSKSMHDMVSQSETRPQQVLITNQLPNVFHGSRVVLSQSFACLRAGSSLPSGASCQLRFCHPAKSCSVGHPRRCSSSRQWDY